MFWKGFTPLSVIDFPRFVVAFVLFSDLSWHGRGASGLRFFSEEGEGTGGGKEEKKTGGTEDAAYTPRVLLLHLLSLVLRASH